MVYIFINVNMQMRFASYIGVGEFYNYLKCKLNLNWLYFLVLMHISGVKNNYLSL